MSPSVKPSPDSWLVRRRLWIEVLVVMCVGVIPHIAGAAYSLFEPRPPRQIGSAPEVAYRLVQCATIALPVLFMIRRSGDDPRAFGLQPFRPVRDSAWAAIILVVSYLLYWVVWLWYWMSIGSLFSGSRAEAPASYLPPEHAGHWVGVLLIALANGPTEELVMRAYLVTSLARLFRSPLKAVLATSLLWGMYHIYYGFGAALLISVQGLVLGGYFAWRRRFWPVALAHTAGDILPALIGAL